MLALTSLLLTVGAPGLTDDGLAEMTRRQVPAALSAYRHLHARPELSNQEVKTARWLAQALRRAGFEVQTGVGGTGLIAVLRGRAKGGGPTVLYRADMDGLPLVERTDAAYPSKNRGVMHACGHDLHMSVALGAMRGLAAARDRWAGTVIFVGQPAEELGLGAVQILDDPRFAALLKKVGKPSVALAIHTAADRPVGHVGLRAGWISANVDEVDVTIFGKGGHGARPHETIDPIVIGSHVVLALQTIVSRRVPPGERAVVTVGKFSAGTKHNIIPSQAELLLTVRSYGDEMRAHLLEEVRRVSENVAASHGVKKAPKVVVQDPFTPAGYNDPAWTERLRAAFSKAIGEDKVQSYPPRTGGEDFSQFSRRLGVPSVMWRLGAQDPKWFEPARAADRPGLHSDRFMPAPKPALETGIRLSLEALRVALSNR